MFPYFGVAQALAKKGYDAVLMDLRRHGRSEGEFVTYGVREKADVKAVADSLVRDHAVHEPIFAFGEGLGAMVAVHYATVDPRCRGVVAVSPFVDIRTQAQRGMGAWVKPEEVEEVLAKAGETGGFDPAEASSLRAAAALKAPLLVIHFPNMITALADSEAVAKAAAGPRKLIEPSIPDRTAMVVPAVQEEWLAQQTVKLATEGIPPETAPPTPAP
jgi:pimeloyl-ACP methyl ester carboxylesterase